MSGWDATVAFQSQYSEGKNGFLFHKVPLGSLPDFGSSWASRRIRQDLSLLIIIGTWLCAELKLTWSMGSILKRQGKSLGVGEREVGDMHSYHYNEILVHPTMSPTCHWLCLPSFHIINSLWGAEATHLSIVLGNFSLLGHYQGNTKQISLINALNALFTFSWPESLPRLPSSLK